MGIGPRRHAPAAIPDHPRTMTASHLSVSIAAEPFDAAAEILATLGVKSVKLMTNNPRKVAMMQAHGIEVVDRVPLVVGVNPWNEGYLAVKRDKSGHLL